PRVLAAGDVDVGGELPTPVEGIVAHQKRGTLPLFRRVVAQRVAHFLYPRERAPEVEQGDFLRRRVEGERVFGDAPVIAVVIEQLAPAFHGVDVNAGDLRIV